jgi:hypothetical protein
MGALGIGLTSIARNHQPDDRERTPSAKLADLGFKRTGVENGRDRSGITQ